MEAFSQPAATFQEEPAKEHTKLLPIDLQQCHESSMALFFVDKILDKAMSKVTVR
jgi:hypothetical protein